MLEYLHNFLYLQYVKKKKDVFISFLIHWMKFLLMKVHTFL